jgi:hypothetical protein
VTGVGSNPGWNNHQSSVAEVGSIQLEWQYLSFVTGNPLYADKVNKVPLLFNTMNVAL